jgi:hypothetical protein
MLLSKHLDYDLFQGERLPDGNGWSAAISGTLLQTEESPVLVANDMG